MLRAPAEKEALSELRARTSELALGRSHLFADLECFVLFVGSGRTGHSLVGSLLDAHPEIVIAHQLHVLHLVRVPFERDQIFHLLLANSEHYARHGREETDYPYVVPNQWQGRFRRLRVIGDKSGPATEARLSTQPWLLERLRETVAVPLRLVHVIRNPFDTIATVAKRRGRPLEWGIERYFKRCETVARLQTEVPAGELLHVRHEALVDDPPAVLRELCGFVGVAASADYLRDCAAIVYEAPRKSRHDAPWTSALVTAVEERSRRYPFLGGYSFLD